MQPPLLARDYRGLPRVLLLAVLHRAALDEADRGLRRLGARDRRRDADRDAAAAAACTTRSVARALCARVRCPVLVIHGKRRRDPPVRRAAWRSRSARTASSSCSKGRASPACTRPGQGQPAAARLRRRRRRRPRRWVRGKSRRKRALYISSPIGLGHAQRDVAIADELRKLHPDLEIDWLAQHPVTAVLEARGERIHPGERRSRERVRPHRERVGRARPALLPGDPADGRDPARELHGLPRPRPRRALRPLDRRRGLGARLLPAREPRAEARRLRRG